MIDKTEHLWEPLKRRVGKRTAELGEQQSVLHSLPLVRHNQKPPRLFYLPAMRGTKSGHLIRHIVLCAAVHRNMLDTA